jgi:uncharacterized protein YndB with AHSA1/START domain
MPNIHQSVFIGAPAEKVFSAITTREGLAGWWTPAAEAKATVDSVARFPFGADYFKEMKITDLVPPHRVKWTCIKGDPEWVGTTLSFQLKPGEKGVLVGAHPEVRDQIRQQQGDRGTLLIFHHDNWQDYTLQFAECSYTWGQFLRSLKLWCETGKGHPWPLQHRVN